MKLQWHDNGLDSETVGHIGPLTVWVDRGADGWRIHACLTPFVIAKRDASLDDAKQAAEDLLSKIWSRPLPPNPGDGTDGHGCSL